MQPLFVAYLLGYNEETIDMLAILSVYFSGTSMAAMTSLAVDRFLALYFHLRYTSVITTNRTVIYLIMMWSGITIFLPILNYLDFMVQVSVVSTAALFFFLISLLCYVMINCIVRRHKRQIRSQLQSFNVPAIKQGRSLVTMFYIHGAFIMSGLPFVVTLIYLIDHREEVYRSYVVFWTGTLVFVNSSVNPYLYCWRVKEIFNAVRKILPRIKPT